jgi:hypothetical protein
MNTDIAALMRKIQALELELEAEVAKRHSELRIGLERGRIAFEEEVRRRHKELALSGHDDATTLSSTGTTWPT